jgi:type IV pilus assembly protein PilE
MSSRSQSRPSRAAGFNLVELMVVVVIAGILLGVSVPSYLQQVRKSRRTEAKTALLDLAGREERYYNTNNNVYIDGTTPANLGYTTYATIGNGYYSIQFQVPAPGIAAPSYLISATPITADQLKDLACLYFSVDSNGVQRAGPNTNGTGAVTGSPCWQ